jgi:hypothetical protein
MRKKETEEKKMWGKILGTRECDCCHNEYPIKEMHPFYDGLSVNNEEKEITVVPRRETTLCSKCYSEIERKASEVLQGTLTAQEFVKEYGTSFRMIIKSYLEDEDYDHMDWT